MRALLLAAGEGVRLRPLTLTTPKCLTPIHGRPLIDYWLDLLFPAIERVLINTHHLADKVTAHLGGSPWRDRIDIVYEPELLGTGGTMVANRAWIGESPLLVAHADNLTDLDAETLIRAHEARTPGCAMTMLTFETDDPQSCGIVETDPAGVVVAFHEKVENPPGTRANAAVYVMEPEVVAFAAGLDGPFVDLSTQVIPHFVGRIQAAPHAGYHRDIGNVESLRRAHEEFRPAERARG